MTEAALQVVLRRDRAVMLAALVVVTALAWGYVLWLAADMDDMGGMDMPGLRTIPTGMGWMAPVTAPWGTIEFVFVFAMWAVMMIGMMTPSAAPMILIYARVGRQAAEGGKPFAPSGWLAGGYLLVWIGFAMIATCVQWGMERGALLTTMMAAASSALGGIVLLAVGLYQWTPLKNACLRYCQSPLLFISRYGGFRPDARGSLVLGMRHGAVCVGCCWALMALLFVGGIMNALWIAAITILVLAEKVIPAGRVIARIAGVGLFLWGVWVLTEALR
jgi:predicted metal-binding membrane protein